MARRSVPELVKRQLRQEAGFGCCKCGLPIYEYHHVVPYGYEPHFRPEDMMLLCPNHHAEATAGAMAVEEQRAYKTEPINIKAACVDGLLKINQRFCAIETGTVQLVGDGCWVTIDGERLLTVSQDGAGHLELSLVLYDRDGKLVASIDKNEWIAGDPMPWDLEAGFQYLKIRRKRGDIVVECDARPYPVRLRAEIWKNGHLVNLKPSGVLSDGATLRNVSFANLCLVGIHLGIDTAQGKLSLVPDARYGHGKMVSWPDPVERLRRGVDAWLEMNGQPTIGRQ